MSAASPITSFAVYEEPYDVEVAPEALLPLALYDLYGASFTVPILNCVEAIPAVNPAAPTLTILYSQ